jgi:hypothetical protein
MPLSILSVVVFPAPFGPRNPINSPASIENDTPLTASTLTVSRVTSDFNAPASPASFFTEVNVFFRFLTSIMGGI